MKKWFIVFCLLIVSFVVCNNAHADVKDSLLRELTVSARDTVRLEILRKLSVVTRAKPQVRLYYISEMLKEAEWQKNDTYKCYAYLYRAFLAFNRYVFMSSDKRDANEVNRWVALLEPLARKEKRYDLLFQGKQCTIDLLQVSEEYERQEKEALLLLEEAQELNNEAGVMMAYQSLSNVYNATYRTEKAADVLEKAYELAVKMNDGAMTIENNHLLINVFRTMKDEPKWLKYIRLQEYNVRKMSREYLRESAFLREKMLLTYIRYLDYYLCMNDSTSAEKYFQLVGGHALDGDKTYQFLYYRACCEYYRATHQMDRALQMADSMSVLRRPVSYLSYINTLFVKASLLHEAGGAEEALALYKQASRDQDSVQISLLNKQTTQLKGDYHFNQLLLEKENNYWYMQLFILVFWGVAILIIACFVVYTYRIRRHLSKAEQEMRKMTDEIEQANVAKERFLSNISSSISVPLNEVLKGSLLLASDEVISQQVRQETSETIASTSAELMKLINDILDLSRLESGMMRFEVSEVELVSMANDVVSIVTMENRVTITSKMPQDILCWVHIDGIRLLKVFTSLLSAVLPPAIPSAAVLRPTESAVPSLVIEMKLSEDDTKLWIRVSGTMLASVSQSQEVIIRNEINRMLIEHFGGQYEVKSEGEVPCVDFCIQVERVDR